VGARFIRSQAPSIAPNKKEIRVLATIIAAVAIPLILVYLLVAADIRADLSELKPIRPIVDGALLIGWNELENPPEPWALQQPPRWAIQPQVRLLGYMMDAVAPFREGAPVDRFILLPDAGHALHPAHRIADQMVEVQTQQAIPLTYRHLVWVTGSLTRRSDPKHRETPSYLLTNAQLALAVDSEIKHFFAP
jgi:hypothetical protein